MPFRSYPLRILPFSEMSLAASVAAILGPCVMGPNLQLISYCYFKLRIPRYEPSAKS